ncbi:MAG: hypothetical protein RI949_3152 [Pseudomonadota bacterium]
MIDRGEEDGAAAIRVTSAAKVYPNGTQALMPVDLRVAPGEFVTLLGPSGCGKSTLLHMVAGLLSPSQGQVEVGSDQRLGFVFQEPTLMPWARVQANVRLPLDLAGMPLEKSQPRVQAALKGVGLEAFARHRPHELSGGMRMRVSLARSLATDPTLLLLDEPFSALDEITRSRLDSELLQLWSSRKLTVLFVTHSIVEAVYLSQRVVVMAASPGRVVAEVAVDAPYPRDPSFRMTPQFNAWAKRLQDLLLEASVGGPEMALA